MFKKPKINVVTPDIANASIYLRSVKKWGKSTLFARVIEEKYGDPTYGLLAEVGHESGVTMLDGVNTVHVDTMDDMKELKKWLITGKETGEHHIRIVAFDTTDEMVPIFEKYVINEHNKLNPSKPIKTINAAFGGFGAGEKMAASLMKDYFAEIKAAGIQVWAIGHTKYKSIKDKANVDTEGYMQLTSNLSSAYEAALGDTFDIVLTGVIDRDIDVEVQKLAVGNDTKEYRHPTSAIRKLYFRGTPEIDAGGRFANDSVPEYMVFDKPNMAADFIKVIENGMAKSETMTATQKAAAVANAQKIDIEAGPAPKVSEPSELDMEEPTNDVPNELTGDIDTARNFIQTKFTACTKEVKMAALDYIKKNCEGGSFKNATLSQMKEIYKIITATL